MKHQKLNTETTTRDNQADGYVEGQDQSREDNETMTEDSAPTEETEKGEENTSAMTKFTDNTTAFREINFMKEVENNRLDGIKSVQELDGTCL